MSPEIYLLSPPSDPFIDTLDALLEVGIGYFQYRRPDLTDDQRHRELRAVSSTLGSHDTQLIVNDRPDLALAAGADGVHLGEEDLPVKAVKSRWSELLIGRTHRVDDELSPGADYYGIGPVFGSFTKNLDVEPCGWEGIRSVVDRSSKPVFAIGGIDPSRLEGIPAGLAGVCVLGCVWDQPDPVQALAQLKRTLVEADQSQN